MSSTYPAHAVDCAARCIVDMCRTQPVAINANFLTDEDLADLLTRCHAIGEGLRQEPYDLVTFFAPEGAHEITLTLMASGCRVVDYRKLIARWL